MWFRLSGRFSEFRLSGQDISLVTPAPHSMTVRLSEGPRSREEPHHITDALVEATYAPDVSEALLAQAKPSPRGQTFESFSVEPFNVQEELRTIRYRMASSVTSTLNVVR